jgi:uncharacterized protein
MHDLTTLDFARIAQDLQIRKVQVESAVQLLDQGNTVPFITRYRKEKTGGLDEELLRQIQERVAVQRRLAERKGTILKSIENQGKLTDPLRVAILEAETPKRLEDLYLPYKPKKRTPAAIARERGLEPLALAIWNRDPAVANLNEVLATLVNPEKELATPADVLQGVQHILAEQIAETAEFRQAARSVLWETGKLAAAKRENLPEGAGLDYKDYFQFAESARRIPPHRILALNRGEKEGAIKVRLEWSTEAVRQAVLTKLPGTDHPHAELLKTVVEDALNRLLLPSLEREIRRDLTEEAEMHAVRIFARNLSSLLMQPPLRGRRVLAIDPGFRTGCKLAALDDHGNLLEEGVIFPHPPPSRPRSKRNLSGADKTDSPSEASPPPGAPSSEGVPGVAAVSSEASSVSPGDPVFASAASAIKDCVVPAPVASETSAISVSPTASEAAKIETKITEGEEPMVAQDANQAVAVLAEAPPASPSPLGTMAATEITPTPVADACGPAHPGSPTPVVDVPGSATPVANAPALPIVNDSGSQVAPATPGMSVEERAPDAPLLKHQQRREEAKRKLAELIRKHQINVIAIGNGTACRETEEVVADIIANLEKNPASDLPPAPKDLAYVIVNEAGASVYSASAVGREEFPNFDATLRGTISIGRRLLDPLSELVKIDPQNIGVGLYQHDLNPRHLKETLEAVVESSVNQVGVDVNTASVPLLRYIAGLNQLAARELVDHRSKNGPFKSREQLLQVANIGPARYEQAAGFLRITDGDNPLDMTWIHPESYPVAQRLLSELGYGQEVLRDKPQTQELREKLKSLSPEEVSARLQIGLPTLRDILDALARPGRDPREELPPPIFKKGILKLEDLKPEMELKGTVLNVVDFGAFIDIGLKDSGLVHISQMSNRYIKSPYDVVTVGDVVTVWVLTVDMERRRVSLTMIKPGTVRKQPEKKGVPGEGRPSRRRRHGRGKRQVAVPGQGSSPAPHPHPPTPAGGGQGGGAPSAPAVVTAVPPRRPPTAQPPRPAPAPRKPQRRSPRPKLTAEALQGETPLRTFRELKAFFEAKREEEKPAAQQSTPTEPNVDQ